MAFSFITKDNIGDKFEQSKAYMKPFFEPLAEYERVARNKPKNNIPAGLPKTTDGTTASYLSSRSKSVIQQLPNGVVKSLDDDKDLAGVSELLLERKIIPNATSTGTVIQKCWAALTKAQTYGAQPGFVFYTKRGDYYGADFKLPYIKDVFFEPGKVYDKDCNYIFMRSWYQEGDIKSIIDREEKAAQNGFSSGWNIANLKLLEAKSKDDDSKTPAENESNSDSKGIEIIFAFQAGIGAKFYGYSPDIEEVVYEIENPDPRGVIPIHYLYVDLDMSNPLGRGSVESVYGLQNMLDAEMQMYQYAQAIMLNPPLKKYGNISSSQIRFKPNAIWDMGNNPDNRVEVVNINTTALNNFPNNYGLIKSQILNINNANDTSISSEIGNPGFSKTDSGVKAQQERVGITDNHLAKQFEAWYGDICETMLNIHFALSHGDDEIELTEEYIRKRQVEDPEFNSTSASFNYDDVKNGFKFEVDFSTSKLKEASEAVDNLKGILELRQQYPELAQYVRIDKLFARLVNKLGIEDPEEIMATDIESTAGVEQEEMPIIEEQEFMEDY